MATSKFKRFGIPAALVVGGVTAGSLLAPIGLASAQEDDADPAEETETTEESESNEGRRGRWGHRGNRGFKTEAVTDALGLTREEIRDGFADGKTLAEMAEDQGMSSDELSAALVDSITAAIEQAVEDGKIDAADAEEKLAEVEAKVEELINKDPADFPTRGDHADRADRGGRMGQRGFGALRGGSEDVQELLGLSAEEIRTAMVDGSSLADLAEQQGVTVEELSDVLVSGIEEQIDQAVEDGKIDADRADEIKDGVDEKIEAMINAEFDGFRGGRGGHGHHGGKRGFGPGADGAGADAEPSVEESSI